MDNTMALNKMESLISLALYLGGLLVPRDTTDLNRHRTCGLAGETEH